MCGPDTGVEVVAVCDLSEEALKTARELTGLDESTCYTDYETALDNSGAECVIICAPTAFHCSLAKQAVDRGLPVLCEKGMAPDWDAARDMVDFGRERDGVFCVSQNYRYNGLERTIQRSIADPSVRITWAMCSLSTFIIIVFARFSGCSTIRSPPCGKCRVTTSTISRSGWGPVSEVTAHASRADWSAYEHPANTSVFMRFENGAVVNYFHGHDAARGELRVAVHGSRGALIGSVLDRTSSIGGLERLEYTPRPATQFGAGEPYNVPFADHLGEAGVLADFRTYIQGGPVPGISGYQNLNVMALCKMVVMSVETGQTVNREELT